MTSGVSAIAASNVTTTSLPISAVLPARSSRTDSAREDSVQLSDTAQKFLAAPEISDERAMVEQLVQAAAAGDVGAMSLLTVA